MSIESFVNTYGNLNEESIIAMIQKKKKAMEKEIKKFEKTHDGCNIQYR